MTPEEARERGRRGGQATFARYGREHMSTIGKRGFAALVSFARGGRRGALARLASRGKIRPFDLDRCPDLTPEQMRQLERDCGLDDFEVLF